MKKSLSKKFLMGYLFIGFLEFFLTVTGGSVLIEQNLEHSISQDLYQKANNIATHDEIIHNISSSSVRMFHYNLSTLGKSQNIVIWILNSKGEIILSSQIDIPLDEPVTLKDFDPTTWGSNYYQISDFHGYFSDSRMSVLVPITGDMSTKGYVVVHYPMTELYQERTDILLVVMLIVTGIYILTFLLLIIYHRSVKLPLQQITKGVSEFTNGNLSYQIPVTSSDEMGHLSDMLNYMSDKLNHNGEYQRTFIANVSHDFRSPLTSIKGYVEAMLDGTIPPQMQEKYLKIIAYETGRLEKLTRSLLTLNELDIQKRTMHLRRFDINETIKSTAETFEGICTERKILLELILSGKELYAWADDEQIQQVLYNLLDNAIKFSSNDSSIMVETTEKNGRIFVSVKDHGCGIPRQNIHQIWDRFYKMDSSRGKDRKGTGLGLSIVKEIISAHNQYIDVISTEGVGTEFIFTLEKAR